MSLARYLICAAMFFLALTIAAAATGHAGLAIVFAVATILMIVIYQVIV